MNSYLLSLVGKWLHALIIGIASIMGITGTDKETFIIENLNSQKQSDIINEIIPHETIKQYDSNIPTGEEKVSVPGSDGLVVVYSDGTKKIVAEPVTEVVLVGSGKRVNYTGIMTAYGADCVGCSKVGNVACHTKEGKNHSLINDGIYYEDEEYGKVRILAATNKVFPCGTIVEISNYIEGEPPFIGVVLDTGFSMRNAWNQSQTVWMDLAHLTEKETISFGIRKNVNFSVKRWGW